jgi:hypothetical protein
MENLFELTVNEQGRYYLSRLRSWAKLLYAFSILTCIVDSINAYFTYKTFSFLRRNDPHFFEFQLFFTIVFLVLYGILVLVQAFCLYQFSSKCTAAMEVQNTAEFNRSFNWLLKHAIYAAALFLLNTCWIVLLSYTFFRK